MTSEDDPTRPGQKVQRTALIVAVDCNQEEAVALLLERGADPNLADSAGSTPLMYAAYAGSLAAVRVLVAGGAALDCVQEMTGWSAFHCACFKGAGHADIAELLVREGCDTARRDKHGRTGRDHAEQFGFGALVERLDRLRVT
jgi:ankyrin repeat protein